MKRAMLLMLAAIVLAGATGCIRQWGRRPWACVAGSCAQAPENCTSCDSCGDEGCGDGVACEMPGRCVRNADGPGFFRPGCLCKDRCAGQQYEQAPAGPATGAVTYPYYTTRGPRDFLAKNPNSIGP